MARVSLNKLGSVGINVDTQPHELEESAWSFGLNVRCDKDELVSAYGHESKTTPTVAPKYLFSAITGDGTDLWLYMGDNKAYSYNGTVHNEVTRISGDYSTSGDSIWDGGLLNGIPVVNNTVDVPQYWETIDNTTKLLDLPAWNAVYQCRAIKPYKAFLVALNITKNGTTFENMVKWSSSADVGGIPASWDETDPTLLAGETELSETGGAVVDCANLRGVNIVYKTDSTYTMTFVGGQFVFNFNLLYESSGILTKRCVTEFNGRHFVVTKDDIIIHDGQAPVQSIANRKVRDQFFDTLDPDLSYKVFVMRHEEENEIWVCYPEVGSTTCNKAMVWNTLSGAWAFIDLPDVDYITEVALSEVVTSESWGSLSIGWDAENSRWSSRSNSPEKTYIVGLSASDIYRMDVTNQEDGVDKVSYVERTGLPIGGSDQFTLIKNLFPRMTGGAVTITVGGQARVGDAMMWGTPVAFDPATDYKVDCLVQGRLHAIKIESSDNVHWRLQGIDIEYDVTGLV